MSERQAVILSTSSKGEISTDTHFIETKPCYNIVLNKIFQTSVTAQYQSLYRSFDIAWNYDKINSLALTTCR